MLRAFLSVVLIFAANVAFASDQFEQYDKKASSVLCYTDSETACGQDINDFELDLAPSSIQVSAINAGNNSHRSHDEFNIKSYSAFFSIRAPPNHYSYY
ncbi:hypothetical protein [Brumicola nitratireducens]|uniref:Uncharacterized protein n=1 Tax=Glaciecola nitratireducens (strain JCM 12485 / KCTC 12276 / FR1064) TaxID=1085623 RepID=G4QGB5_GLANF|nr:hypothetical protein [Glaciecola nitratireducens]AEP29440.1 hypothetical protein GNIT_1316 [Glaciecola nitratireducens FR1064]